MPPLQDSTAWIAATAALGAAVLALLVGASVIFVVGRRRRRPEGELERMRNVPNAGFQGMLGELARALERARDESRRSRHLSAIGSTIDLDRVLARALDAAAALPFVEAAMVIVAQGDEEPILAAVGMSAEEAARHPIVRRASGGEADPVAASYRDAEPGDSGDDDHLPGGLVLPLRGDAGEAIGKLAAFWRDAEQKPTDDERAALEELAASSAHAIENALRFREARKLADLDALTNLYNRRYFHDTLAREVARAHRYDRRLALVILDIDDFKAINERVGHLAGDSVLAHLAERVRSVVREADIACRVGGDEFAVILPESTLPDAEQLYRRLQSAVSAGPAGPAGRLHLSAGMAELDPENDAVSFFKRADDALFRAKETGKDQAIEAGGRPGDRALDEGGLPA